MYTTCTYPLLLLLTMVLLLLMVLLMLLLPVVGLLGVKLDLGRERSGHMGW